MTLKIHLSLTAFIFPMLFFGQCPTGPITLSSQTAIDNFATTYPGCTALPVGADLVITGNTITNLNALSSIVSSAAAIEIRNNPLLVSISGLSNLTHAGTELAIRNNPLLANLTGLQNLQEVGGEFVIRTNNTLTDISSLTALTTVNGGMIVRDCQLLTSLNGLQNLTTIGDILEIVENDVLADVSALGNITTITGGEEGAIIIEANPLLTSIMGLGNDSTFISGDVTIQDNALLSQCAAQSICNYLSTAPDTAIITITANLLGCDSVAEVLLQCEALTVNEDFANNFSFYPNPAKGTLNIEMGHDENTTLYIYDTTGQLVRQATFSGKIAFDLEGLSNGLYLAELKTGLARNIIKLMVE